MQDCCEASEHVCYSVNDELHECRERMKYRADQVTDLVGEAKF